MTTIFDAKIATGVAKIMAKFGNLSMTLTRQVEGAVDYATNSRPLVPDPQAVTAAPLMKVTSEELRRDDTIKQGSSKVLISPVGLAWNPEENCTLADTDARDWTVYKVQEIRSGEDVAAWCLYLTRAGGEVSG